jgi:glycosyltransferase involved in cell wall biosynthesis
VRIAIDARKIADFGIGTYVRGLLGGLVALDAGDEIVALAPREAVLPAGVERVELRAPHYSLQELIAVGRAAARAGADILHSPHYVTPVTSLPLVVTIHDLIHLHQPLRNPLAPFYARAMIGRALRTSSRVLTVSETVKRQLADELGADASRIHVTPNGVEPLRGSRTAQSGPGYFLFVGNDKPHKNVAGLVAAFALVRKELPGLQLVLAGSPFDRYAGREGIVARGFVAENELADLYAGALALVLPSHEEGFGLPAAEAMASGTAVITSNAPALVEVTADAALHADASDERALAAAMVRVASDDALRAQLESRGAARARSLTWMRCAALTRAAYEAALASL